MAILKNKVLYVLNDTDKANIHYEAFHTVDEEIFLTADLITGDTYDLGSPEYMTAVKSPISKSVVRIYLLNKDETLHQDISDYIIDYDLSYTYQQGITRTGNINIMNFNGEWNPTPHKFSLWKGSKFKIETGLYYNEAVYWKDCGIYVCGDLSVDDTRGTISFPVYDKFALVDGTISGKRASSFSIPVGTSVKEAVSLCLSEKKDNICASYTLSVLPSLDSTNIISISSLPSSGTVGKIYLITSDKTYYYCQASTTFLPLSGSVFKVGGVNYRFNGNRFVNISNEVFDTKPIVFPVEFLEEVTPYSINTDPNCTMGEIIVELADMISCDVYYNSSGNLTLTKGATTNDDLANRSVLWNFKSNDGFHTQPAYDIKFSGLYNQIVVAGSIESGKQYKAMVINDNPQSQMNVYMTEPNPLYIEDSNLIGDASCNTRGKYEMIKQGRLAVSIHFDTIYVPHLDCNSLILLSDDKLGFENEKFVINSISVSSNMTMSLVVSSVDEVSF